MSDTTKTSPVEEEKKQTPETDGEKYAPAAAEAPAKDAPKDSGVKPVTKDEAPAPSEKDAKEKPEVEEKEAEKKPEGKEKGKKKLNVLIDTVLVLVLVVAIAVGGYYAVERVKQAQGPTPLEAARKQNEHLKQVAELLEENYAQACKILELSAALDSVRKQGEAHMQKLAEQEAVASAILQKVDAKKAHIKELQKEIIRTNNAYRSEASALFKNGVCVGKVTRNGTELENVVIYYQNKNLGLDGTSGEDSLKIRKNLRLRDLKFENETLRNMLLFVMNRRELVDMSDFDPPVRSAAGRQTQPRKTTKQAPKTQGKKSQSKKGKPANYDPVHGAPTLDTK